MVPIDFIDFYFGELPTPTLLKDAAFRVDTCSAIYYL